MSTFASTAMPSDRMNPAMPDRLSVIGISLNSANEMPMYKPSARMEKMPVRDTRTA